ncbi:MAG TPA: flagellar filament capping protein FliD [Polyangiales bacterium]|nr:flagellar filament capping protein FliD [Polyangiales bacterium]
MAGIGPTPGMGSNLDVGGLVEKLMSVEKQPLTKLDQKEAAVQVKISAYGQFRGSIQSLRSSLAGLQNANSYTTMGATITDSSVASVSASAGADVGSHTLEVTDLAVAQRLKSGTFTNITDTVGTGTLTIQYGTYDGGTFTGNGTGTSNIKIDSSNNTLAGVRDAINKAGVGVTASIVNDGTGNRLVIASKSTGTTNSLKISVADTDNNHVDNVGLSQLAFDPAAAGVGTGKNLGVVTAAKDASFLLDGIQITKPSNSVSDAISGVTINLSKTNVGTPTTFTVSKDSTAIKAAIDGFVKAYNELDKTVDTLTGYDAATRTAGTLSGDAAVRSVSGRIRDSLSHVVAASPGGYTALAQVGITLDRSGQLKVDGTKLQKALDKDPLAVQGLFATAGRSDDSLVSFVKAGDNTKAGTFAVDLTQLATQGTLFGNSAAGLTIDSTNDTLDLKINGTTSTVKLTQKTYTTAAALASELQSQINGNTTFSTAGVNVKVTENAGVLTVTSGNYGSASKVEYNGGNGIANLFGTATSTAGLDVAGKIGTGLGAGNGQQLTSSDGLVLKITGGSTGARGNVVFQRGIASDLDRLIGDVLSAKGGTVPARIDSLQEQVKDIDKQREVMNAQLEVKQKRYLDQFNTLDGLLTNMQSTMSYLSQQLASLNRG